jgi:hypothetical protein
VIQTHGQQSGLTDRQKEAAENAKLKKDLKRAGLMRRDLDEELFGREYDDAFHDFD